MRSVGLFILAAIASLAACSPKAADARTLPHAVTVLQTSSSPDSLKYVLRWTASTDAFGSAGSYNVAISSTKGFSLTHTITGTVDSFTVIKPAIGDSVSFTAKVSAVRRGLVGPSATVSWKYVRKDVAPPVPGPVVVDSSQVIAIFIRPQVIDLAAGDTVRLCSFVLMGDSTLRIGVDTLNPGPSISYCSGAPLTQFKSERST